MEYLIGGAYIVFSFLAAFVVGKFIRAGNPDTSTDINSEGNVKL